MSATPENCFHLSVDIVREIHAQAIARFGGADGVREVALLASAVAAPLASRAERETRARIAVPHRAEKRGGSSLDRPC